MLFLRLSILIFGGFFSFHQKKEFLKCDFTTMVPPERPPACTQQPPCPPSCFSLSPTMTTVKQKQFQNYSYVVVPSSNTSKHHINPFIGIIWRAVSYGEL
ncbi:hypothetical protein Droror1_Dr00009255 [Drosera rotundifolia]